MLNSNMISTNLYYYYYFPRMLK